MTKRLKRPRDPISLAKLIGDIARRSTPRVYSSVHVRYVTSATTSGRTHRTRESFSGEPKRLSRGGGSGNGV
jgi:hypothetical protein